MTPGPTLIVKPTVCSLPFKARTLGSGNTFGVVLWSDGKCEASMMDDEPWLRKHPDENVLFWTDEWELIDTLGYDGNYGKGLLWIGLVYADVPTEHDYLTALESGTADTEDKICDIRIRLWWVGNDPIRESAVGTLPPHHMENLTRLAPLLSENDPQQRLMKAKVFRELGFLKMPDDCWNGSFPRSCTKRRGFWHNWASGRMPRVARFP